MVIKQKLQEIFFDESGFTGANLLDEKQPFFVYAAVAIDEKEAEQIVMNLKSKYHLQGNELKFSNIRKRSTQKRSQIISDILKEVNGRFSFTCFEKKYALCAMFFEYIFEPCLSDNIGLFYCAGFHHYIAYLLYNIFFNKKSTYSMMFDFANIMKVNNKSKLIVDFITKYKQERLTSKSNSIIDILKIFISKNKDKIIEEMKLLSGDSVIDKYTGDLTLTSVFHICSSMCKKFNSIKITYDKSNMLDAHIDILKDISNHEFFIPNYNPLNMEKKARINIDKNIEDKDSKQSYAIQVADMMSGIINDCFKTKDKNMLKLLLKNTIYSCVVIPEIHINSFVEEFEICYWNVLMSLVENSINQKPLVDDEIINKLNLLAQGSKYYTQLSYIYNS